MNTETKQKSWLSRPEGKVGAALPVILMVGLGIAGFMFWGAILPWLIVVLTNTITALLLCGALALIGLFFFLLVKDQRWRTLAFYLYKSGVRAATGAVIDLDPISILKTYLSRMVEKQQKLTESIAALNGQIVKGNAQMQTYEEQRQRCLELAEQAHKQGPDMHGTFQVNARQAERLRGAAARLKTSLDTLNNMMRQARRQRDAAAVSIEDLKHEVEIRTTERAAILASYSAYTNAKNILEGGDNEREIFDMAMEKTVDEYNNKMGEIETFMDMSKSYMDAVDLDNAVASEKALKQFETWEKERSGKSARIAVDMRVEPVAEAEPLSDDFSDLFNNNEITSNRKRN